MEDDGYVEARQSSLDNCQLVNLEVVMDSGKSIGVWVSGESGIKSASLPRRRASLLVNLLHLMNHACLTQQQ